MRKYNRRQLVEAIQYWTDKLKALDEAWMTDGNVTRWFSSDDVYDAKKDGFWFTSKPSHTDHASSSTQSDGPHRMQPREYYAFIDALKRGQVTFKYQKKDGSIRTAKGTLSPDVATGQSQGRYGYISYWDIDAGGWRMFNANNFISKDKEDELEIQVEKTSFDDANKATQSVKPTQPRRLESDSNVKWLVENNSYEENQIHDNTCLRFIWQAVYVRSSHSTYPDAEFTLSIWWDKQTSKWKAEGFEYYFGRNKPEWGSIGGVRLLDDYLMDIFKNWNYLKAFLEKHIVEKSTLTDAEKEQAIKKLWTKPFVESYDDRFD